ncbi:MAG TPA: archaemetzincin family Zn-dependent metalloprotease [Candidatus Polarisedimenticolaceae bacterium]|nr:archaemetzincin family Zn-dependent metalloprotease [Candidatus Polarisedimenticolaceae bacterium]
MASPATVDLVPIYLTDYPRMTDAVGVALRERLGLRVRLRKPWFDPEAAYDLARGQYSSRVLLELLLDDPDPGSARIVAITTIDLFAPVLTYVFGEAQLDGRAAVVSLHRLRPEAYGLACDERLVRARLVTETVHELGHTFGLLHCNESSCVMHPSTYAEEIDQKTDRFCDLCSSLLSRVSPPAIC